MHMLVKLIRPFNKNSVRLDLISSRDEIHVNTFYSLSPFPFKMFNLVYMKLPLLRSLGETIGRKPYLQYIFEKTNSRT